MMDFSAGGIAEEGKLGWVLLDYECCRIIPVSIASTIFQLKFVGNSYGTGESLHEARLILLRKNEGVSLG